MCCGLAFKAKGRRDRSRGKDDGNVLASISRWTVHWPFIPSPVWDMGPSSLGENCLFWWFPALPASFPKRFSLIPSPYSYILLYSHLTLTHIAAPQLFLANSLRRDPKNLWTRSAIFNCQSFNAVGNTHVHILSVQTQMWCVSCEKGSLEFVCACITCCRSRMCLQFPLAPVHSTKPLGICGSAASQKASECQGV